MLLKMCIGYFLLSLISISCIWNIRRKYNEDNEKSENIEKNEKNEKSENDENNEV